jgi:hypothetical protein
METLIVESDRGSDAGRLDGGRDRHAIRPEAVEPTDELDRDELEGSQRSPKPHGPLPTDHSNQGVWIGV